MRSKLYRSVIGVGLSLGGATAAVGCSGESSDGSTADPATNGTGGGAGVGGGPTDGGSDAPVDAFCDTAWPTTKGNPPPPPSCEEQAECANVTVDGGHRRWLGCRPLFAEHVCDFTWVTSVCEDGAWTCPPDSTPEGTCWCYGPIPEGMVCVENVGWQFPDGGSGGG
jgi:hypothetical protein